MRRFMEKRPCLASRVGKTRRPYPVKVPKWGEPGDHRLRSDGATLYAYGEPLARWIGRGVVELDCREVGPSLGRYQEGLVALAEEAPGVGVVCRPFPDVPPPTWRPSWVGWDSPEGAPTSREVERVADWSFRQDKSPRIAGQRLSRKMREQRAVAVRRARRQAYLAEAAGMRKLVEDWRRQRRLPAIVANLERGLEHTEYVLKRAEDAPGGEPPSPWALEAAAEQYREFHAHLTRLAPQRAAKYSKPDSGSGQTHLL